MFRFSLLLLLLPLFATAQLQKNSFLLAGNGSLSTSTPAPTVGSGVANRVWQGRGATQVGYFLDDVFCLGGKAEFEFLQQNNLNYRYAAVLVSPFMRFYVEEIFFVEASYGFGRAWERTPTQQLSGSIGQLALGGGLCLFLSERISFEPQLFFVRTIVQRVPRDNNFVFGAGIALYIAKPKRPSMQK